MPTIFDSASRARLVERIRNVDPARKPAWGMLTAVRMLGHLEAALRMGMGEIHCAKARGALSHWPINKLVMHVLPWPKGAPTTPELLPETEGWDPARSALESAMERFAAHRSEQFGSHPAFGEISTDDWGRLMHRHIDHHLRQFGA